MSDPIRLDFGKHKGKLIVDVPTSYLEWVLREFEPAGSHLRKAIELELNRRYGFDSKTQPQLPDLSATITQWHRKLAMKYHPDRTGGSHEAMAAINDAVDQLKDALKL